MVPNGLAWMRLQDDGSGAVLAVRPLNGVGITRPVSAADAKLYPSDLFPVFDDVRQDRHVYAAWLISSGARQSLGTFGSDQLLAKFCSGRLVHAPGKVFDYNNCDYIMLGKIIERVCGKSYDAVLAERILTPLHLTHTGMLRQQMIVPRLVCSM